MCVRLWNCFDTRHFLSGSKPCVWTFILVQWVPLLPGGVLNTVYLSYLHVHTAATWVNTWTKVWQKEMLNKRQGGIITPCVLNQKCLHPSCLSSQGTLFSRKGGSLFLFLAFLLMCCPTSSSHYHQEQPNNQQYHRHHLGLREVIVGVRHTRASYTNHQWDYSEGEDAAIPGFLHASCGLRKPL